MEAYRTSMRGILLLVLGGLAACSSTESGGPAGDATTDGAGCSGTFSCFCGSPICVEGTWKCTACGADTGADTSADAGSIPCGTKTCGANQVCVHDCCGGAPTPDGGTCTPPPPTCLDIPSECAGTPTCGCLKVPTS